jgi:hypothetical protein
MDPREKASFFWSFASKLLTVFSNLPHLENSPAARPARTDPLPTRHLCRDNKIQLGFNAFGDCGSDGAALSA